MKRTVRTYTKEFKQESVRLALKSGSVINTADSLGIPPGTLQTWMDNLKKKGKLSAVDTDGGKDMSALVDENRRLHKALAIALEEKEILKKAAACVPQAQTNITRMHVGKLKAIGEMMVGPSISVVRNRYQTTSSCCC